MKKKFYILCAAVSCCLTACGGSNPTSYMSETQSAGGIVYNGSYDAMPAMSSMKYESSEDYDYNESGVEQKLIRRVSINLELESNLTLEENAEKIQQLVSVAGGYTANVSLDNRDSWANGRLELKVPKDKVDGFLSDVKALGIKVTSVSDSAEDVTMQYTDTQTRLEVQETALRKYKQYLDNAENIEEFLSIEQRIDSIVSEIESYKAKLRVMDNQIDYTEITVQINCKTSVNRDSFWVRAGERLKSIGYEVGDTFLDGFEWFVNALIVLLFVTPIGIVVVRIIRFAVKGKWKFKLPRLKKKEESRDSSAE